MCASTIPADLTQFGLRVFMRFLFERILAFVGGPREAWVPSFARMRFAHQTALRAAHRASRSVRAWQLRFKSAGIWLLRTWMHPNCCLMRLGPAGQAKHGACMVGKAYAMFVCICITKQCF